ncbi:HAD-IIA family hydrolase [Bacillus daqingensis]|uniref:HAD-IIA family hydrolase n=1 Tax=Bacillus daqingensis TaxID=872396 RepID=A0ABV9NXQ0_9BACI
MPAKGLIVDLDGTVYWQDTPIPGAVAALNNLKKQGHHICYLTNNATKTTASYVVKLRSMGLDVEEKDILTAPLIAGNYLKNHLPVSSKIWVEGEPALFEVLTEAGLILAESPEQAEAAIFGGGPSFSHDKLTRLLQAYLAGAEMYAVNPDVTCPIGTGLIPDTGAWAAALKSMMKPQDNITIIGKPSEITAKQILQHLKLPNHDCFVIGDRLDTDIRMANQFDMHGILVLTGVSDYSEIHDKTTYKPNTVLTALSELTSLDNCN